MRKFVKKFLSQFGYDIVARKGSKEVIFHEDKAFHGLYNHAQKKCQMENTDNTLRRQRHYTLNYLLKNANFDQGDVCELGCWRGLSAYQIASYIQATEKEKDVSFFIFDSFEGLSPYQTEDLPREKQEDLELRRKQFACSFDTVKNNLKEFSFIKYYKGWIPDRFPEVQDRQFSFVHVDVDLYQPIYDAIQFFYPRLINNGIMVFDDYGYIQFPGAKKAVDLCLAEFKDAFFVPLPSGQAFLIRSPSMLPSEHQKLLQKQGISL